jgi:battenin
MLHLLHHISISVDIVSAVLNFCLNFCLLNALTFQVKLSGPYWFHYIQYRYRIIIACLLMALSFIVVAIGGLTDSLWMQLLGVILGSTQSGFGEASFLAFTAFFDSRVALTAWSSGTGFAGVFGFAWVIVFTEGFQASFEFTLFVALVLPILFFCNFEFVMNVPDIKREVDGRTLSLDETVAEFNLSTKSNDSDRTPSEAVGDDTINPIFTTDPGDDGTTDNQKMKEESDLSAAAFNMTMQERISNTLSLWPFMIPLFLVYFAEYAMQSGVWAAFGFPVEDEDARNNFYEYSNWMYQVGVLVSRSSGMLWKADMNALWIMPLVQCGLLAFFILDAYYKFWYDWSILTMCFVVGLMGGAVYVNGFALIAEKVPPHMKEFSLSAASIADSLGIAFSTVAGIFIQKALYDYHNISDDE